MTRNSTNSTDVEPLLTAREVREMTGVSESALHEWAAVRDAGGPRRGPVHVKLGRNRRWARADVLSWIEAQKVR